MQKALIVGEKSYLHVQRTSLEATQQTRWQNLNFSPSVRVILGGGGQDLPPTLSWVLTEQPSPDGSASKPALLGGIRSSRRGKSGHFKRIKAGLDKLIFYLVTLWPTIEFQAP